MSNDFVNDNLALLENMVDINARPPEIPTTGWFDAARENFKVSALGSLRTYAKTTLVNLITTAQAAAQNAQTSVTTLTQNLAALVLSNVVELANNPSAGNPAANGVRLRSVAGRIQIRESPSSRWRWVIPADNVVDIREFSTIGQAIGNNETGDTDMLKAAFSYFSGGGFHSGAYVLPYPKSGTLYIPTLGVELYIGETLVLNGSPGNGVTLKGERGASRGGSDGSTLTWVGDNDGDLIHFRGMNGSTIKDLQFNGGGKAKSCFWASELYTGPDTYDGNSQIGSSGLFFENCNFGNPRAAPTSTPVKIGVDNGVTSQLQASEMRFYNCLFAGRGDGPGRAGCHIQSAGNTKNFTFRLCQFIENDFGVYQPGGSGVTTVDECSFGDIGFNQDGAAIYMGSGNALDVRSFQMENGNAGYRAKAIHTENGLLATVSGGYLAATLPSDDIAMSFGGPSLVTGFHFERNSRAGSNTSIIEGYSVEVRRCSFSWNNTPLVYAPVNPGGAPYGWDSGVVRSYPSTGNPYFPGNVICEGNLAGQDGSTYQTFLKDIRSFRPDVIHGSLVTQYDNLGGAANHLTWTSEEGRLYANVPIDFFQAAGPYRLCTAGVGYIITGVSMRVITPYAGVAGPLHLVVGHANSSDGDVPDSMLVDSNPAAVAGTVFGVKSTDMGPDLHPATRKNPAGWPWPENGFLIAELTSESGAISSLTDGLVQLCIEYKWIGG